MARHGQQQCLLPKSKGQRRTQLSFLRLTHLCHQPEVQGLHLSPQPTVPAPRALEAQLPRGQERRSPLPLVSLLSWAGAPPCGHAAGVSGARRSKGPRSHHYLRDGFMPAFGLGFHEASAPRYQGGAQDCGTPTPTGERGTHPGWVQEVGREAAELTSHHLSLFCLQGFACKSHVNREYISWWGVCCLPSRPPLSYRGHLVVPGGPLCPSAGGSLPVLAWHSCPAVGCWMPRSRVLVLLDEVTQLQSGHAGAQPHASMGSPRVLTSRVFLLPRVK